jgi:hypothetical protein
MAVGIERHTKKAASRLEHALFLNPVGDAMSYNPLSHTSGVGHPGTLNPSLPHAKERSDLDSTIPSLGDVAETQAQLNKKRRHSKPKVTAEIRRSSSTPHMRNLALGTPGDLSPTADKRRNKLGYHRTSVACGKQKGLQPNLLTRALLTC